MIRVMNNSTHIREFHDKMSCLAKLRGQQLSSKFLNTSLLLWFYRICHITNSWVDIAITHNNTLEQQYLSNS